MDLTVSDVPRGFALGLAFVFGATWGSFFNVAIYRWPRDMSVARPASSHCPGCGAQVAARYNIPILGYLFLRGKTACCGAKLSVRYPIVEALSGVLCLAVTQRFLLGAGPDASLLRATAIALCYFAFVGGLVIATFVDLEHMLIPDEVSLPGAALGLVSAFVREPANVADLAIGAGAGFLVVQVVFVWAYEMLTGRRGMGEGDAKLLMMIGAFCGWQGVLFSIFVGSFQGLIGYGIQRVTGAQIGPEDGVPPPPAEADVSARPPAASGQSDDEDDEEDDDEPDPEYWGHSKLPFGPFLALGALEFLFFGDVAIEAWFRIVGGG